MNMNKLIAVAAIATSTAAPTSSWAAALDLAGADRTVTDVSELAAYDEGVTNSSSTLATLTFDIATDQIYAGVLGGNLKLVKSGTGTLTLSAVTRTYTGGTLVNAGGMLKLGESNKGILGTGAITIADGAAIDFNGCLAAVGNGMPAIYAAGTGTDGTGAILNTGTAFGNNGFDNLYLTGDLLIYAKYRMNFVTVHTQGHTLRYTGAQQSAFTTIDNSQGGDISIESGTYTAWHNSDCLGTTTTADSGSVIRLKGGSLNFYSYTWGKAIDLYIEPSGVARFISQYTAGRYSRFSGRVHVNAPVTLTGAGFNVFNGRVDGSGQITINSGHTFGCAISASNNAFTGPVVNNGTLCISIDNSYAGSILSSSVVTNNGTIKLYCRSAVTSTTDIIGNGGTLLLPDVLSDDGSLTLKNCVVSNTVAQVDRGTLTLGSGLKWISPGRNFTMHHPASATNANLRAVLNINDGCEVNVRLFSCGNAGMGKATIATTGIVNQVGGTFRTVAQWAIDDNDTIRLGHYALRHTIWNMSGGEVHAGEPYLFNLSIAGYGELNMSGGAIYASGLSMCARLNGGGESKLNFTGGELNVGTNGISRRTINHSKYKINLGGGTIRASHENGFDSVLNMSLTGSSGTNVTFDTQAANVTLSGVLSGAGGLQKAGSGALTLSGANTYAGATTVKGGTVAFTQAYPGGDLEIAASALANASSPLVTAAAVAFASGKGVRILDADTLDPSSFSSTKTIASSTAQIAALPSLTLVASDGTTIADTGKWHFRLSTDGCALKFGSQRGLMLLVR